MFLKPKSYAMTPEMARKEMKKREIFNWGMIIGFLSLLTIGVLEVITRKFY